MSVPRLVDPAMSPEAIVEVDEASSVMLPVVPAVPPVGRTRRFVQVNRHRGPALGERIVIESWVDETMVTVIGSPLLAPLMH